MDIFPNHMLLDISVEAENKLGTVESEHLIRESAWFGEFASLLSSQAGVSKLVRGFLMSSDWCIDSHSRCCSPD